jgi:hypothetical protein
MTDHLRPEEFIEALDGQAEARASEHLAACAECRAELDELRAMMRESAGVEAPAPSPLFWDHFSERVRVATSTLPAREAWWESLWRPAAAFAAAAALLAAVMVLVPRQHSQQTMPDVVAATGTAPTAIVALDVPDDGSWSLVVGLASGLRASEVREAAQPAAGTADAMIDELTPAQRAALARLLEKEIGEQ